MNPIKIVRKDTATLSFQVKEDGVALDITGLTFKLAVKEGMADTAYKVGPLDGTIDDAATGRFSFAFTTVETDQAPFAGVM
ncbi:hypothetical protein LCGC14_2416630, partial [marine sediment metagenome]